MIISIVMIINISDASDSIKVADVIIAKKGDFVVVIFETSLLLSPLGFLKYGFLLLLGPWTLLISLLSPLDAPFQSICDFLFTRAPQTLGSLGILSSNSTCSNQMSSPTSLASTLSLMLTRPMSYLQPNPILNFKAKQPTYHLDIPQIPQAQCIQIGPIVFLQGPFHLGFERHHHSQISSSQKAQNFLKFSFYLTLHIQLVIKTCQFFL